MRKGRVFRLVHDLFPTSDVRQIIAGAATDGQWYQRYVKFPAIAAGMANIHDIYQLGVCAEEVCVARTCHGEGPCLSK